MKTCFNEIHRAWRQPHCHTQTEGEYVSKDWPDPKCSGPHDPGSEYDRREHTTECNLNTSADTRYKRRFPRLNEVRKDVPTMRS